MLVRDILRRKGNEVFCVEPHETLRHAVGIACDKRIGALLVMTGPRLHGIITERDILMQCHAHANLDVVRVRDAMTQRVITGVGHDEVRTAMDLMTERRIRHLPILDGDRVMGLVSIGDVVNALRTERAQEVRHLKDYMSGAYL